MEYDVIIIGAGLSGLAAGIRLAHFDRRVCILEQHGVPGGLNSYYRRHGFTVDAGLHAVTNYPDPDDRAAPLCRLCRQLRIPLTDLALLPQTYSEIQTPDATLRFSNDTALLKAEIARVFPDQTAAFEALVHAVRRYDALSLDRKPESGNAFLASYIDDARLRDLLLMPLMYYGNPDEHDMECGLLCIMFRSLFLEGFSRPAAGIRTILSRLTHRYSECGGELRFRSEVKAIRDGADGRKEVVLADDTVLSAAKVLSSAGYIETLRLCRPVPVEAETHPPGRIGHVETVFFLDRAPADLGFTACIRFVSTASSFTYARPHDAVDLNSAVLCAPSNFRDAAPPDHAFRFRITHLANPDVWFNASPADYAARKRETIDRQRTYLNSIMPGFEDCILASDMFTPRTIQAYTGHINGAIYGSPRKVLDGRSPVDGIYICGTDQGFLGIVGAMLSGVSIANQYLVR